MCSNFQLLLHTNPLEDTESVGTDASQLAPSWWGTARIFSLSPRSSSPFPPPTSTNQDPDAGVYTRSIVTSPHIQNPLLPLLDNWGTFVVMSMVSVQWMCIHARSTDIPSLVAADHVHVELRAPNGALHNHFCDACKSLLKLDCLARWLAALSIHILHANATTLYRWPLAWCLPRPSAKRYNIYFSIRLLLYSYKTLSFVLRSYYTWIRDNHLDAFLFFFF